MVVPLSMSWVKAGWVNYFNMMVRCTHCRNCFVGWHHNPEVLLLTLNNDYEGLHFVNLTGSYAPSPFILAKISYLQEIPDTISPDDHNKLMGTDHLDWVEGVTIPGNDWLLHRSPMSPRVAYGLALNLYRKVSASSQLTHFDQTLQPTPSRARHLI